MININDKKPLGNYDNLSILYAQHTEESHFNKKILGAMSKIFHSSLGLEDTLNKYLNFKEINGFFFDLVIIDNRFGLDICHKILEINPAQKIIIKVRLDSNQYLSSFYVNGFDDFIYEPLSKLSIEKTINTIQKKESSPLLVDNKENINISNIVSMYEDKLYDAQRKLEQRSEFFASMSHEIRTPMNAIIGLSQTLLQDSTLSREQQETVKTIYQSSNMLLTIINDILDFSKIEAGKISLEKTSFDLNMILSYLADMMSLKAQEKGIKLTFVIDHNIGKNYLGDPFRISQVLLNLLSNAVKFTNEGGVTLRIKTVDSVEGSSTVEFEVSDTGIGLKEEEIQNLFQSYSQASSDTSRKYGGTGLGLTISKKLVDIMNGKIWVKSEAGKGSSFFVTLTLNTDKDKRKYRLPSKDIMGMRVLIIDSDVESVDSLTNLIRYFQMPVQSAANIDEAKKLMANKGFDILFIDKDLFDLFDVKSYKLENKSHIVLIECWANILRNEKIDYSTVDEVLKKPFHQQRIFEILSSLYNINGIPNNTAQIDKYNKDSVRALGYHKILIAEDNKINQKVMSGLLRGTEIEIEFADDGQEALDKLEKSDVPYELIFMDVNMPNMDGLMASQIIRKKSLFDKIPIIGLSGHGSEKDTEQAKNAGMQEYLLKPIDVKALYEVLIQYLGGSKN
ncbi:MAG: response regulator [Sulfurimonas sp.]|jgi:signal transduction histidine kinase/DNA-binding response OmpR family regulator